MKKEVKISDKTLWPNGFIRTEVQIQKNKPYEQWKYFGNCGENLWIGNFENKQLQNQSIFFFSNGQIRKKGIYQSWKEEGLWSFWHQNGKKFCEGIFSQGEMQGNWSWWDEHGKLVASVFFINSIPQNKNYFIGYRKVWLIPGEVTTCLQCGRYAIIGFNCQKCQNEPLRQEFVRVGCYPDLLGPPQVLKP